jgi:hypothetical protein
MGAHDAVVIWAVAVEIASATMRIRRCWEMTSLLSN